LVSANGPSVQTGLPPRLRTVVAVRTGASSEPPRSTPAAVSAAVYSPKPVISRLISPSLIDS